MAPAIKGRDRWCQDPSGRGARAIRPFGPALDVPMNIDAIFTATGIVAAAEIGDKTQLLAVLLASRFRRPLAVSAGILVATLANHALAAWAGSALAAWFTSPWFHWAIALSFLAMAAWALVPDRQEAIPAGPARLGALGATAVAFFLVEMGDKTQVATVALGARYGDVLAVTIGTTLGMMLANVPAVLFGEALLKRLPLATVRLAAAVIFAAVGVLGVLEAAGLI